MNTVGSMSVGPAGGDGLPAQLLGVASLINLEALYRERGLDIGALADGNTPLQSFRRDLDEQLVGLAVRFPGDPRHAARQ